MDFNIELIGIIAAILTTSGFAPQIYKSLKTKEVGGVSLTMYVVMFIGLLFWLYYGILMNSFSMILANTVSGMLVLVQIVAKIIYSNAKPS
ncbi:SemiSWEET family sugar transporter [Lutimonas sp.]|jgi:MtN3 and saliva related transmembrane protein|uniref:SemiSWEET family sugar transporter n=1 Tax=Lutimonas sp. TaxID=1872403 RepID=UPI003C760BC1